MSVYPDRRLLDPVEIVDRGCRWADDNNVALASADVAWMVERALAAPAPHELVAAGLPLVREIYAPTLPPVVVDPRTGQWYALNADVEVRVGSLLDFLLDGGPAPLSANRLVLPCGTSAAALYFTHEQRARLVARFPSLVWG